ncbi:MAG TPA: glycosyltransferase, partial [Pirellulales bacterium]|nr:glycosyltransferase [Pirellulales bacterium]
SGIPPLGLMQALAAGVPAVATDAPANRELVIHDQTGFLVPPGDRAGRARCANRLLNDAGLRARLSDAARHRVAAQFNIALLVARHVELYRHICR